MSDSDLIYGCPVLNDNGLSLVAWVAKISGTCMYGLAGEASFVFGYLSLFSWLWAQLPQVIENYKLGSVEGLSWLFLFNWFLGDLTNLIGCLLTEQLFFQRLLATYYLIIDVILISQYIYYSRRRSDYLLLSPSGPGSPRSSSDSLRTIKTSSSRNRASIILSLTAVVAIAGAVVTPSISESCTQPEFLLSSQNEPHELFTVMSGTFSGLRRWFKLNDREFVGRIFAWACTTMYLTSRMPQIYKNFVRQSTSGLSILLFVSAFLGNVFYTLSILTSAATLSPHPIEGTSRADFIWEELPYLLGSAGTVGFDFTIFCQWVYYGEGKEFFYKLYYGRKAWEQRQYRREFESEDNDVTSDDESNSGSSSTTATDVNIN
ncbi:PQ loop repeat-domain-containing protein [Lipomyces japonicus]|uniref:PQ loop repeat-domain-containing protein n=1 Tax=Lipomyces japonicus TaxID=56871 RepID=UPI0034CDC038